MLDIRQTPQYARYLSKIGWQVEEVAGINYFIKKVPLLGSVLKVQRPQEIRINKIRNLAKKYRAFQIIVEPKTGMDAEFLTSLGFKLSKSPYLPTKTLQIDLSYPKVKIIRDLKKDARSILKKEGKDLRVRIFELEKINEFRLTWKNSVGLRRYIPSLEQLVALKKTFKKNSLFIATPQNSAGALFLKADKIAYYWQAFTSKEGRKVQAQYKIVWEGIKWAKSCGAKIFDFEGIYDPRFPQKSWLGFSHFKKSFGGAEVEYPGTFTKSRIPL